MPLWGWPCTRTAWANFGLIPGRAPLPFPSPARGAHCARSAEISVSDVLLHHTLRVEERAIDGDGVLHDLQKSASLVVIHRQNHTFQFGVERFRFGLVVRQGAALPRAP